MTARTSKGSVGRWVFLAGAVMIICLPVGVTVVSGLHLDALDSAVAAVPLGHQYLVSVMVTTLQTAAQIVTASLAAYALTFPVWRGRTIAFALVLLTLAVPGESTVIPNIELVGRLGLRDTVLGIAVPFLAAAFPVFLLRQAFRSLPRDVWEASMLDGAGHLRSLVTVVLPMSRSQVATAVMWCALAAWNGYFWPLLITDSPQRRTVQVGIGQLVSGESSSPDVIYAGTLIALLPTFLLVVLGHRFLVRGLAGRLSS